MATRLEPGVGEALFARMGAEGVRRGRVALEPLARAIEIHAKTALTTYSHRYGTRTPARPGGPPALISGTLRRSVVHTQVKRTDTGWECRVGMAVGTYAVYRGRRSRTPASRVGYILEVEGTRNGDTYPFLGPAFRWGVDEFAPAWFRSAYGDGWTRLV